ncbi:MAG: hypothetical protein WD669_08655 [Pirellulales bacterium]
MSTTELLQQVLDPFMECLTPEAARKIVELRASPELQMRLDQLADRANEGVLTQEEMAEYDRFLSVLNLIAILQSKARQFLKMHPAA